jgi:two-component system, cell cycle sensor histidine kinase and response regulator CckA
VPPVHRTVLDVLPYAVFVSDATTPDHTLIYANEAALRATGYGPDELIGRSARLFDGPHTDPRTTAEVREATSARREGAWEVLGYDKSGAPFWNLLQLTAVRDEQGAVTELLATRTDITHHKQTAATKRSQVEEEFRARARLIAESSPHIMYVYDCIDQRTVWSNRRVESALGYTPEQVAAFGPGFAIDILHPDDRKRLPELLARWVGLPDETVLESEYRMRHADGTWRWFLGHDKVFLREPDGRVRQLIGTSQDITGRKRVEEALRESEAFLNATGRVAKVGGWEVDCRTREIRWTEETGRIYELPPGHIPTVEEAIAFYHPDDREAIRQVFERAVTDGVPWDGEFRLVTARGNLIWTRSICSPEFRDGEVVRLHGTFQDITERKAAEAELAFSHLILRKVGDAIMVCEAGSPDAQEPRIVYVNEAFESSLGYPSAEVLGRPPSVLRGPDGDPRTPDQIRDALRREPVRVDLRVYRKDGSDRWVEIDTMPVSIDDKKVTHLVSVLRDITDRLAVERKLRETQKIESLGLLAGGVAHDFNNLLTSILGYASLSESALPPDTPVKDFLAEIERAGRRASELCQQLLAYAGRGRVVVGPINLSKLVDECVRLARLTVSTRATLSLHLAPDLPHFSGDASQFRQVIMNLVMNASDALGEHEGVITITTGSKPFNRDQLSRGIFGDQMRPGEYVYLEVTDTGCGMDAATKAKIFDPFFTTKPGGRGLGMAAVLGIVKVHRGSIRVESTPGAGTTLTLVFPCGETTSAPAANPRAPVRVGEGMILVVDDEEVVRNLTVRMVKSLGFQTREARDGQEAVEVVRRDGATLRAVLLDMTMPRLNGREAYAAIRKIVSNLPVLVMSGYSAAEVVTSFEDRHFVGFLQKPYSQLDLADALNALLNLRGTMG